MNKSQLKATVALAATMIMLVCAAVAPHLDQLPPEYRFWGTVISILGAAAGAVVTAVNQSLSPNHVSIPVKRAKKLGLIERS